MLVGAWLVEMLTWLALLVFGCWSDLWTVQGALGKHHVGEAA